MPSLPTSKKKKSKDTYPVAHILTPARRLAEAKRGSHVTALCGKPVTGDPDPEAGICASCVIAQFEKDDKAADTRAQQRYDVGKSEGQREGRNEAATQQARIDREQADRERAELSKPRFETQGKNLKFTYQDGSTATVRSSRVGSVRFAPTDSGTYQVLVDGVVLIEHADVDVVRKHHDQVHTAVFGAAAVTS